MEKHLKDGVKEETKEDHDMNEIYKDMERFEALMTHTIDFFVKIIGGTAKEDIDMLLDGCRMTGLIEIVSEPTGENQDESQGIFSDVWVDQWSVGDSGDSYAGYIYGKFAENKWIKIPYDC